MVADTAVIRVVHIVTRTNIGGVSNYLLHLIQGTTKEVESTVIRGSASEEEGDYFAQHEIPAVVLNVPELRRNSSPFGDLLALIRVVKILRQLRPDIVHTHMAKAGVVGRLAALIAGTPIRIHTFHGHLLYGYFGKIASSAVILVERCLRRVTTHVIVNGERVRQDLIQLGVITALRSSMIPPAVNQSAPRDSGTQRLLFGLPMEQFVVGFIGRLATIKRPDRVVELAKRLPEVHFAIFGDGPLRTQLESSAKTQRNVSFHGWVREASLALAAVDALVLTSDNEAVAIVLIEAAQARVPVCAMDVGSVSEIVLDGETGLLASDLDSLEVGIRRLISNPDERLQMASSAAELANLLYTRERLVAAHLHLYSALLRRQSS